MIDCRNISKRYRDFYAVKDMSVFVGAGKICGFLGMNGAGKTTSIRMITGVIEPTAGDISIAGHDMKQSPTLAKSVIGYIPDRPYIYPSMTSIEYLQFVGSLYDMDDSDIEKQSEKFLKYYSLWSKKDELVQGFSHGMKQRLATCAALIHKPKVLVVDEPMVGLDPIGAKTLKKALKEYANEGTAILLSTHSLHVAEELCDHIIIIHNGVILTEGSVQEIKKIAEKEDSNLENVFLELINPEEGELQI